MRETVDLGERKVTLVGTAHISEESRREVEETIEEVQPDLVGVELDQERFDSLRNRTGWRELDLAEAIREGKGSLLAMNLFLSIYQRRLGMDQGVKPGEEMLEAVETAEENGIKFELLDRPINETFQRLRSELSLWEKLKFFNALFLVGDGEDIEVEDLKHQNVLDRLVSELDQMFPSVSKVFLRERNAYMTEKLLEKDFDHAVVVVGAAHLEGMKDILEENKSPVIDEKDSSRIPWMKLLKYGFPALIIAGLGYSFYQIGFSTGVKATKFWILSNGILAMLGAIAARSHITTWIVSFLAAPLTSLDPAIGAGMVASYFEGKFYPPTVEELEEVVKIERYRELWSNQTGRIILTFIFVTIGSALATFISAGYIASLISGI